MDELELEIFKLTAKLVILITNIVTCFFFIIDYYLIGVTLADSALPDFLVPATATDVRAAPLLLLELIAPDCVPLRLFGPV